MARETKVGLLAGLAFIVCFAIILANRGRNGPPGLSPSVLSEAALNVPAAVQRSNGAVRNPPNAVPSAARTSTPAAPARPPIQLRPAEPATHLTEANPASGAELPGERLTGDAATRPSPRTAMATPGYPAGNPANGSGFGALDPNRDTLERVLASRSQPGLSGQPDPSMGSPNPLNPPTNPPPVITGNQGPGGAAPPGGSKDPTSTDRAASRGKEHTVVPGETLSSIAASHYGTKARSAINTILDANRSVVSDANQLKVGMVLSIPQAPPKVPAASKTSGAPAANPPVSLAADTPKEPTRIEKPASTTSARSDDASSVRWYQVKKNDRFASIAREQLGDAGRWKEVYELNKDKFPDPAKIRDGVRIKLPPKGNGGQSVAHAENRR